VFNTPTRPSRACDRSLIVREFLDDARMVAVPMCEVPGCRYPRMPTPMLCFIKRLPATGGIVFLGPAGLTGWLIDHRA
jgi:hypothetical protein